MKPNIKEEEKYSFKRKITLIRLLGMIGKKKDSIEMQQFLEQLKKLEDFVKPLLGYDES